MPGGIHSPLFYRQWIYGDLAEFAIYNGILCHGAIFVDY